MGPMRGPGPKKERDKLRAKKPDGVKDVPRYVKEVTGGFLKRIIYIFKLVWEARPLLMFVLIFMAVFNGVMPIAGSYITANLLNSLASLFIGERNLDASALLSVIILPLGLQFGYTFFRAFVNFLSNMVTSISGELVTNHIKVKMMYKAKEIDVEKFDMPDFYSKLENASREAGMRPIQILRSTFDLATNIISIVSYIIVLFAISGIAPFIVIAISIPSAIITFKYRRKQFDYMFFRSKDRRKMSYFSDTVVDKDLAKEIRLFGLCDEFTHRYQQVFETYFAGLRAIIVKEGILNIVVSFVTTIVNCGLFFFIAFSVYKSGGQIGDYSLYTGALTAISTSVTSLVALISGIYEGSLFIDNLIVYMSQKKKIKSCLEVPAKLSRHTGHTIEFRDVSFRYPGTTRDVIKHINLSINAGDTIVMVGLNGAGKTTLIKLLTRLYDPTDGEILLDGRNIKEYEVEELYKMYGIIFQDFGRYAVNVKENIAFGNIEKGVVEEDIITAAEQGNCSAYIERLPRQYDTPLMRYFEDDGLELSIGQWQKLAIARAFYSDSDIMILDEPTASLDAIAEQEVFSQFDKLSKDKTTVFVSHRLSSATLASKILVLKEGELIEEGNHEQLMAAKGEYYRLFSTQAKRYISGTNEKINDGTAPKDFPMPQNGRN